MSIVYSAPNALFNLLPSAAAWTVRQLAAQGFPGATLFVNPVAPAGVNAGGLQTYASFLEANPGFAPSTPIYFQLQVPGKPDYYIAGLVAYDLGNGVPAAETLQ